MENKESTQNKHWLLNLCVLGFVVVLTIIALISYFVATFCVDTITAYYIASIYILCMLLAAPTLKVFIDKINGPMMKKLNVIGVIFIFSAILVLAVMVCLTLAFPNMVN